ncbi:dual specificity phosphatase 29-like [Lampetra fluviatilis]
MARKTGMGGVMLRHEEEDEEGADPPSMVELKKLLRSGGARYEHMDEVFPDVYIGNENAAHDLRRLGSMGFTHVLNAAHGSGCPAVGPEYYARVGDVAYLGLPADDFPSYDMRPHLVPASDFIHAALQAHGRVLVHCVMGRSRSASLVLAYLMLRVGLRLRAAVRALLAHRSIFPNDGFLRQLIDLDRELLCQRRQPDSVSHGESLGI